MSFTGNEDNSITLALAGTYTHNYQNANTKLIKGQYFGKSTISRMLSQEGCVGIRVYYALDGSGVQQLIIVGVDANENDLYNGVLADKSVPCPDHCGVSNPLNR